MKSLLRLSSLPTSLVHLVGDGFASGLLGVQLLEVGGAEVGASVGCILEDGFAGGGGGV